MNISRCQTKASASVSIGRRLREAEVRTLLGDHAGAAVILFDVVERDDLKIDPRYDQAVFLLAEAMRKAGYFDASKSYYERFITKICR